MALHGKKAKTEQQREARRNKASRVARLARRGRERLAILKDMEEAPSWVEAAETKVKEARAAHAVFISENAEKLTKGDRAAVEKSESLDEEIQALDRRLHEAKFAAAQAIEVGRKLKARLDSYKEKAA